MTLDAGGWQELRRRMLDAIPAGVHIDVSQPYSLGEWSRNGYYAVVSATKRKFEIDANSIEVASALVAESSCLLDHAAEHRSLLAHTAPRAQGSSPAWLLVTAYYWCFFNSLALTRLTGHTTWHMSRVVHSDLKAMAPAASASPGSGPYYVRLGQPVSATQRRLELVRSKKRLHESVWVRLFKLFEEVQTLTPASTLSAGETRMLKLVGSCANRFGADWPSEIRNAVNYRPGYAYKLVTHVDVLRTRQYVQPNLSSLEQLLDSMDLVLSQAPRVLTDGPKMATLLLITLGKLLHRLANQTYKELVASRSLCKLWHRARLRYLREELLADVTDSYFSLGA